jgi:hypothetical protein
VRHKELDRPPQMSPGLVAKFRDLARTSHQLSTAAAYPSVLTALRSVGLLDVLQEYACAGLGRDALSGRRLHRLATKPGEKCDLGPLIGGHSRDAGRDSKFAQPAGRAC